MQQLTASLDAYLSWIEANARTWRKLMRSAATLPEAGELVEEFRSHTLARVVSETLRDLLVAAFGGALFAAQQADSSLELRLE